MLVDTVSDALRRAVDHRCPHQDKGMAQRCGRGQLSIKQRQAAATETDQGCVGVWPAVNQTAAGSGTQRPITAVWAGPAVNQTAAGNGAHRPIKARSNMSTLIQSAGGGRPAVHVHSLCQTAPTARDSDRNRS